MPRVNPYKPQFDYNDTPTTSGALLFVGLIAAIVLAAIMWASYVPQPTSSGVNLPGNTEPATPLTPRTPPVG